MNARKILDSASDFMSDRKHRKTVIMMIAASLILASVYLIKTRSQVIYVMDKDGSVRSVILKDRNTPFRLGVRADKGKRSQEEERDIILNDKSDKGSGTSKRSDEVNLDSAIDSAVSDIEDEGGRKIDLPAKGSGGVSFTWTRTKDMSLAAFFILPVILISAYYYSENKKLRDLRASHESSVIRMLPSFNDQLLLLLESGMTFGDAFNAAACGYAKRKKKGYFEEEIIRISDLAQNQNRSIAYVINEESVKIGIREFSRLASTAADCQYRGVDICSKLDSESVLLWQERKNKAGTDGKLAETKLVIPLAVLLLMLILITTAPAFIQG
jgi:tight adherence protein C